MHHQPTTPLAPAHRALALAGTLAAALTGCAGSKSPLAALSERELRASVAQAATNELAEARVESKPVVTTRGSGVERLELRPDLKAEIEAMSGLDSYNNEGPRARELLGTNLLGQPAKTVTISLERSVRSAASNNLSVQFARLAPAVSQAQVLAAEAAFDWTLFSNLNYSNIDSPRVSTGTGTVATTANSDVQQSLSGQLGLRRQLVGGGRFTLQTDVSNTDNNTRNLANNPNPANQSAISLTWDQPLLRNAGSEANKSEIRLARNSERAAIQTLRRDLTRTLTETEKAYWQLVRSAADLRILQRLLERGEKVRDQLRERERIDANRAQIADATARVERRKADVLRAQTQLRLVSDQLKALMNDPSLPVGSEVVLLPADMAVDAPVRFSLLDSLSAAVQNRPEVQQSILTMDDASIRQVAAANQRLPDLNLRLQTRFASITDNFDESLTEQFSGEFVDYVVSMAFEMPIGLRRGEAEYRRRMLERMQAVIGYRNSVQQVVSETKSALNRVVLNYPLIEQTRTSRVAAAEVLRVLLVEKEQGGGYTVERLDLELNREESLAAAEREEVEALAEYNAAIADLYAAMGTTLERNNIELVVPAGED
jgi:outer membrane protein TolC